jgi:nucleotide-binding universal stress UspA family protein
VNQIVVPLDGSALAEIVLPCVEELAQLTGAGVTLVRIVAPLGPLIDVPPGRFVGHERAQRDADAPAHDYLTTVARQFGRAGVAVRTQVGGGDPAEQIIQAAGAADLIALSTHGRSGIGRWAFGTVADKVVRGAPVPVLTIRADQTDIVATGHPRHILVPLDGSALAERALPLATELARQAGATLQLVRGVAWPSDRVPAAASLHPNSGADRIEHDQVFARAYLAEVGERLIRQGLAVTTHLQVAPAAEAILARAAEAAADLIVMSTHGRGGLGRWAVGSVADRVLQSACMPVLLVRAGSPPAHAVSTGP